MNSSSAQWWNQLPATFYREPDHPDTNARFPLQVRGAAAADRVLRTGLGSLMTLAMAPRLWSPWSMRRERAQLSFYHSYALAGDPDQVFVRPPRNVKVLEELPGTLDYQPEGIPCRKLSFESPFQTLNPDLREGYSQYRRNRTARALHFRHDGPARPTLIFLHGFLADSFPGNTWGFSLKWLFKKGYDILLVTEPFHGQRREHLHPFSGFGFFSGGFAQTNEAMLQAVCDVRVFMDYLEARGTPHMGVAGYSLGGYIATMLASVERRLSFCIPNSPVVTPIDMALEWLPIRPLLLTTMKLYGLSVQELRQGLALHSPLSFAPRVPPEHLLIIGGLGDRLTSPRFVRLLHKHWQGSRQHWFPGNHLLHFQQPEYLRLMLKFMNQATGKSGPLSVAST